MTCCRLAARSAVRWITRTVPLLSLLASAGCTDAASPHPTAAASPATVECGRIAGDGRTFYESNPTYRDLGDDDAAWPKAAPERQGMDPAKLNAGLAELGTNPSVAGALVVRHGRLVAERYFHGGDARQSDNVHSVSKSILQALVHIAVAKGHLTSLDDPVATYLPEYFGDAPPAKKKITIRHLLTMTSGLDWTEDSTENQVEKDSDWIRAILGRPLVSAPGTTYTYSTGNTHVVSAVLQRATRMDTCRFAHRHLFGPMGITAEHWGRDPRGVFSGGYNVYLTPREMAKFGLLYLNDGTWDGRPLVPQGAVRAARARTTQVDDTFGYSEGWWTHTVSGRSTYFAWGHGGQFVYVVPDADLVLVISARTGDDSGDDSGDDGGEEVDAQAFVRDHLLPSITGR